MRFTKSAFLVSLLTFFSRITGFARDILIARTLGSGIYADIFLASFKLANFFRKFLGEGAFFGAFVPEFTRTLNNDSKENSVKFASEIFTFLLIILVAITIVTEVFMGKFVKIMSPGFDGYKLEQTIFLSRITFLYFIFITISSVLWGVTNGIGKFFWYGFVPSLLNITMIVFIGIISRFSFSIEVFNIILSISVVIGGVIQFVVSYFGCVKNGYKIRFYFPNISRFLAVSSTFKKMVSTSLTNGITQINTMFDSVIASFIPSAVSYLYYSDRIFYFPLSIVGVAMGVVILPMLSSALSKGDYERSVKLNQVAIKISFLYCMPASIVMLFASDFLIKCIFEYGDFNSEDTKVVANLIKIFGLGLSFCIFNKSYSSIFFANNNTKIPLMISLFSVFVNAISSYVLSIFFGVYGIASGTMLSYFISFLINMYFLRKHKFFYLNGETKIFLVKVIFASLPMLALCVMANNLSIFLHESAIFKIGCCFSFVIACVTLFYFSLLLFKIDAIKITFRSDV